MLKVDVGREAMRGARPVTSRDNCRRSGRRPPGEIPLPRHANPNRYAANYSARVLRLKVPVAVVVAAKRATVGQLTALVPGAILRFSRSADEPLDLVAGGCRLAGGQCVRVGERFGLRIISLERPDQEKKRGNPAFSQGPHFGR